MDAFLCSDLTSQRTAKDSNGTGNTYVHSQPRWSTQAEIRRRAEKEQKSEKPS